jgi:hypothetical protein
MSLLKTLEVDVVSIELIIFSSSTHNAVRVSTLNSHSKASTSSFTCRSFRLSLNCFLVHHIAPIASSSPHSLQPSSSPFPSTTQQLSHPFNCPKPKKPTKNCLSSPLVQTNSQLHEPRSTQARVKIHFRVSSAFHRCDNHKTCPYTCFAFRHYVH